MHVCNLAQKSFEVVLQTVRTHHVKQMFTLLLYANIPTAAGLQR